MNKCFKRAFSIILALCLSPLCAALSENVEDILVVGILSTRTTEIRPLNPLERDIISVYGVVYESMVTIDDNGIPQPLLAENWAESGGGKTWTFTLRENVTFSDGTPLLASDVAASCQWILDMANNSELTYNGFYQNMRYFVDSVKAADDRTVVVKAKNGRTYYGLLYQMTFPIVPASQIDMANPVGTGPYVIQSFEPGNQMLLQANPLWWQTLPQVTDITVRFYTNNKTLINDYEYSRVDTAFTRSVSAAQYKSGINSLSIPYTTRQLEVLLMNHRPASFPLDSVKVRQAIRYALNIPLLSQNAYMGMTQTAHTPTPADSWLYYDQEKESAYSYNPQKAAELLAEEGWADLDGDGVLDKVVGDSPKRLHLQLCVYEDPENNVRYETASMIKDMLKAVKIDVKITTMTYDEAKQKLESGKFDLALCSFQMDVTPDYGFFLIKKNKQNYGQYVSSEMSSLFDTLRTNQSRDDFAYTSQAIQQQFTNDVPFVCLFYRAGAILTRKMYSTVRTFREFELLRGIEAFGR